MFNVVAISLLNLLGMTALLAVLFRQGDNSRQPRRFFILLGFVLLCFIGPQFVSAILVRQRIERLPSDLEMLYLLAAVAYAWLVNFEKERLNWRVLGGFLAVAIPLGCWRAWTVS
ncbi:MAG: hypothetical protein AB7K24_01465 [Gemmataceae bacterium]